MLTPAASYIWDLRKLKRKRVLALAEYRHACDYGGVTEDELYHLQLRACEAEARVRAVEIARDTNHVVTGDQLESLALRLAPNIRGEISFTVKRQ